MNISNRWQTAAAHLCAEIGPEDGIDPRLLSRGHQSKAFSRKHWQLCKEAERILALVLSGATAHPLLRDLQVLAVQPEGNGRQLCVSVNHDQPCACSEAEILDALTKAQGYLRSELARSIHRKRVPMLRFQYLHHGE